MDQRDKSIDIAKCIGIIFVVWAHAECPIHREINMFHMPLFFYLSGILYRDILPIKDIVIKKTKTLIIPYIVLFLTCESIFLILSYITGHMNRVFISPGIIFHPWGVVGPLWFLQSLFEVTIFYAVICKIFRTDINRQLISVFFSFVGYLLSIKEIHLPLYIDTSFSMLIFYSLGHTIHKTTFANKLLSKWYYIILIIFLYLFGIKQSGSVLCITNQIKSNYFIYFSTAMSGIFLTISVAKNLDKIKVIRKILGYVGQKSLYIFAFHILFFELVFFIFGVNVHNLTYAINGVIVVYAILASILLSYILIKVLPSSFK